MKHYDPMDELIHIILFSLIFIFILGSVFCGASSASDHGRCFYNRAIKKYNPIYRTTCWLTEEIK